MSTPSPESHHLLTLPPNVYYFPNFITEQEEQYLLQKIADSPKPKWKQTATGRRLQYWGGTLTKSNTLVPEPLPSYFATFPNLIERIQELTNSLSLPDPPLEPNQVLVNEYQPDQGISPHEDGPTYEPHVSTISLSSPTLLSLYQYLSHTVPSPPLTSSTIPGAATVYLPRPTENEPAPEQEGGKAISATPIGHVYLEPRSLLLLRSSAYSSHLHGITASRTSIIRTPEAVTEKEGAVEVANAHLLDGEVAEALKDKGWWESGERGVRVSLTFRRVKKVSKGGGLLGLLGAKAGGGKSGK